MRQNQSMGVVTADRQTCSFCLKPIDDTTRGVIGLHQPVSMCGRCVDTSYRVLHPSVCEIVHVA